MPTFHSIPSCPLKFKACNTAPSRLKGHGNRTVDLCKVHMCYPQMSPRSNLRLCLYFHHQVGYSRNNANPIQHGSAFIRLIFKAQL
jgi:hypothetical protein